MSNRTPCNCQPESFPFECTRHHCRKGPRWYQLCQNDPDIFARYESGNGPGQTTIPTPKLPPAPEVALPCMHRGEMIRSGTCNLCGLKGQPFDILACSKHGECSLTRKHSEVRSCVACEDRAEVLTTSEKPVPSHQFLRNHQGERATGWFNLFRGQSAFLICGGPSLANTPLHLLRNPGLLTAAVNNAAVLHRPQLWFSVDVPGHFSEAILRDGGVAKFLMWKHNSERIRRWDADTRTHRQLETRARDLSNVWFFEHDKGFDPHQFLTQPKPTWGWGGVPGAKAALGCDVMLPAIRILHWMGIRTLFIVGADFQMDRTQPYAFDEVCSKGRVQWNNRKYEVLNDMFRQMQGHFTEYGLRVFNCTSGGSLTAFPRMPLQAAVELALNTAEFPKEIVTRGMYVES